MSLRKFPPAFVQAWLGGPGMLEDIRVASAVTALGGMNANGIAALGSKSTLCLYMPGTDLAAMPLAAIDSMERTKYGFRWSAQGYPPILLDVDDDFADAVLSAHGEAVRWKRISHLVQQDFDLAKAAFEDLEHKYGVDLHLLGGSPVTNMGPHSPRSVKRSHCVCVVADQAILLASDITGGYQFMSLPKVTNVTSKRTVRRQFARLNLTTQSDQMRFHGPTTFVEWTAAHSRQASGLGGTRGTELSR